MAYGTLTVVCGPMYAGKTTELLKRVLWTQNGQGKNVLVVKPAFDNRYGTTRIVSHDGLSASARPIDKWDDFIDQLAFESDMICLDEGQFFMQPYFDGDIIEIIRSLLKDGKHVVVNGLDMDWQGAPFEVIAKFSAMADEVIKAAANCTVCGRPARKTFKKSGQGGSVELGAHESYEARCNDHWHCDGNEFTENNNDQDD